jgi:hypothetical protein
MAAYGRRPVLTGSRYAAGDGSQAVCGDGVSVSDVVQRVHCDSLGGGWWGSRPQFERFFEARAAFARGLYDES